MYTYLGQMRILILDSTLVAWSEGKCVLVHVEEDILLDHGRHLPPLLCGGVHGFGEVEADMQRFNPMQNVVKVSDNSPAN